MSEKSQDRDGKPGFRNQSPRRGQPAPVRNPYDGGDMYIFARISVFPTGSLGVLATFLLALATSCAVTGCGASSSPQEACNAMAQMNFPGDPQIAGFLASAGTKDCLLSLETDTEKAATLQGQGQLDALKGFLLMGVRTAPGGVSTDSLKAKIL